MSDNASSAISADKQYSVVLPCDQSEFADFIAGLLAKPQMLEKRMPGSFDLGHDDIRDLCALVQQRVSQQHDAELIQFSVTTYYNDGASIHHPDLESFLAYNEIRPVIAIGCGLSWGYLIRFPQSNALERQEIDVRFKASDVPGATTDENGISAWEREISRYRSPGSLRFQIRHTNWTWGADVASILSHRFQEYAIPEATLKRVARRHSTLIGVMVFLLVTCAGVVFAFLHTQSFAAGRVSDITSSEDVAAMLSTIRIELATGLWPRFQFSILFVLVLTIAAAIAAGFWSGSILHASPPSFLRLTKASEQSRMRILASERRSWLTFIGALLVAVFIAILSDYLGDQLVNLLL